MGKKGWTVGSCNICFDCKKACGQCSWSAADPLTGELLFQPVPGWTAEKIEQNGKYRCKYSGPTWHITACPLFEPDDKRKGLTDGEKKAWLAGIKRAYGGLADG